MIHTASGISAVIASSIPAAARGGGTKSAVAVAPVKAVGCRAACGKACPSLLGRAAGRGTVASPDKGWGDRQSGEEPERELVRM